MSAPAAILSSSRSGSDMLNLSATAAVVAKQRSQTPRAEARKPSLAKQVTMNVLGLSFSRQLSDFQIGKTLFAAAMGGGSQQGTDAAAGGFIAALVEPSDPRVSFLRCLLSVSSASGLDSASFDGRAELVEFIRSYPATPRHKRPP